MPKNILAQTDNYEPYAVLSEDNTVLTFYYDDQKEARNGMSVGPFEYYAKEDISGSFSWSFPKASSWYNQKDQITDVIFDASFANCKTITSTALWFCDCSKLTTITGISNLNTENVTDMGFMFKDCTDLYSIDVSGFKTGNVTSMICMFAGCSELTSLDVSNFNTANVTRMARMFRECARLQELDVSGFKTDNVTSMSYMFQGCTRLKALDISGFKTDNVTDMSAMFKGCSRLTNLDISGLKTDNVTRMNGMFSDCSSLTNLDVSSFNTEKVTDMGSMFSRCSSLTNLDVSGFNTDNVTSMNGMFIYCSNLTSLDVSGFKTDNVTSMSGMFNGCSNLTNLDVSGFKTGNVTNMSSMFYGCKNMTSLDVSGFKTDNVTDMNSMFHVCSSLTNLDVSGFKTDNVTNMSYMFYGCSKLISLDVTGFKTDNVTNMSYMFYGCSNLTSLDLNSFNTSNVTHMSYMFYCCFALSTIRVSSEWVTSSVQTSNNMFYSCTKLVGGLGTKYSNEHTDCTYARIDGGSSNPGYFSRSSTHTLSIMATGHGTIDYDNNIVRDTSTIFTVDDGISVNITITPDDGYRVKRIFVDNTDVKSKIKDNKYTINEITHNISVEAEFEIINKFTYEGLTYIVTSEDDKNVVVANGNFGLSISIPNKFIVNNIEWNVIGFDEGVLDNNKELAAIIWNPECQLSEKPSNPNLLLYVKSEEYAPTDSMNIIVDGKAKSITLEDGSTTHNFYCPKAFVAEQISYVHNYGMKTGFNTCQGWETIVLPFDVATITNKTSTQLVPYTLWKRGDNTRPFWLYSMNGDGWKSASAIKANIPYVISMPNNNNYNATYNQSGDIVFSASNVEVKASDELANSKWGHLLFIPNYQHQKSSSDIYALNVNNSIYTYTETDPVEGSAFIRELRDVGPFEAYMMIEGNASATRSLSIFGDDDTTDITVIPTSNGYNNGEVRVYLPSGVLLKSGKDDSILLDLPHGIYIVNGKKVIK